MGKKLLAGLLALTLCLGLLPMTALAATDEWFTVSGIEGGQIRFNSSTGTIIGCEDTVTSADIPSTISGVSVKRILSYAFEGCTSLTSVTIPEGVTSIERNAFFGCSSLTGITIPESVTDIGVHVFDGCTGLKTAGPIGSGCNYQFGWTEVIPDGAFAELSELTEVTIPDTVTTIGNGAFSGCLKLPSIDIPAGVTRMEVNFVDNYALTAIHVDPNNPSYSSKGGVLLSKAGDVLKLCPRGKTFCVIPDTVKTIAPSAFSSCISLTGVTIPDSVTDIGEYAFNDCTSLTSVTIPGSVTSIGDYAFFDCTGLKRVVIAEGVETIRDHLFNVCSALEEISIPSSVTTIGEAAFIKCTSLKTIHYAGSGAQWGEIDIGAKNLPLHQAAINYDVPVEPTPQALPITPDRMFPSCTPDGPGYEVTLTVAAGHWLTVQTRQAGSVALTEREVPGSGGSMAQVTFSAPAGSVIQAWETREKMTFTDGVPDNVILSTVTRKLSAPAQVLSGGGEEAARPASLLQTAGTQMLGEVGGDSISVTMNDLIPNGYYLGAVWDEGKLLALFDAAADENGAFSGEVGIGTKMEPGVDYRVGVSTANVGGGEPIRSQVEQTGGSGVTVERSGSTVVVSDPKGKLSTCETVIAARYSERGQMLDVVTAPYAGNGMSLCFSKAPESAYRWRFFFLDSQQNPLCERVFLTK